MTPRRRTGEVREPGRGDVVPGEAVPEKPVPEVPGPGETGSGDLGRGDVGAGNDRGERRAPEGWDALVLAGGAARRMGGRDKAAAVVGGRSLLDRVLRAVEEAGRVVVVGPPRPVGRAGAAVRWVREQPPGGGPVAAIAAGLALVEAPLVVVLAVDLPFLSDGEVTGLRRRLAEPDSPEVAVLVDPSGRQQYLAACWRTAVLRKAVPADPAGASVRSLLVGRVAGSVAASARACHDCDDERDLAAARAWGPTAGPDTGTDTGTGTGTDTDTDTDMDTSREKWVGR